MYPLTTGRKQQHSNGIPWARIRISASITLFVLFPSFNTCGNSHATNPLCKP